MFAFSMVSLVLTIAPLVLIAAIVMIVILAARSRPVQPGPIQATSAPTPGGAPTRGGVWNAEVLGSGPLGALGGTLAATFGVFRIEGGTLSFVPEGSQVPAWQAPCAEIRVRRRSLMALDGADLELEGPMGTLRCTVSTEHINRLTRNSFKDFRERGYATGFAAELQANGARAVG